MCCLDCYRDAVDIPYSFPCTMNFSSWASYWSLSPFTGFAEKRLRIVKSADMDLDPSGFQRLDKNCKYWALCWFDPSNFTFSAVVLIGVLTNILWLFAGLWRWWGYVKVYIYIYTGCPGGNVPAFGRMFLTLKYTDITQNTYIRSWTVTEIMAREKCGLLVFPRTVPVSRVVTRTLRMSVLQSHSQVKHIPPSLSTDVTVTVEL